MNRKAVLALLSVSLFAVVACQAVSEDTDSSEANIGLVCLQPPVAKTYVNFDGAKLEEKRDDESVDANRARFKPFSVMADEYKRVLGNVPKSLAGAADAFGATPARWFAEPGHSGVSLSAAFSVALEGCTTMVGGDPERAKAPTSETASAFCKDLMEKAYGDPPTSDQVNVCADLATKKLGGVADARGKWAHVCASVLTASPFLTY